MTHGDLDEFRDTVPALLAGERRCYPRFRIVLTGCCSVGGGPDVPCTTIDLSLGGAALHTLAGAAAGERVVIAFPQLGILEGCAVRPTRDGFALAFVKSRSQHRRLTRLLVARLIDGEARSDEAAAGEVDEEVPPDDRSASSMIARLFGA